MRSPWQTSLLLASALAACNDTGGEAVMTPGCLLVTQVPAAAEPWAGEDPDLRYPPGSRVVLVASPRRGADPVLLSEGLAAAGAPALAPDGERAAFMGLTRPEDPWQIYLVDLPHGRPERLTSRPAGAADPVFLPDGRVVFTALAQRGKGPGHAPHLAARDPGGEQVERLTHGAGSATSPTLIADGRILFVGDQPGADPPRQALFTINPDGTCLLPYGAHHAGAPRLRRPREAPGGRVVLLAAGGLRAAPTWTAVQLPTSNPFQAPRPLLPGEAAHCLAVEPTSGEGLLMCLPYEDTHAVFTVDPEGGRTLLFDDDSRHEVEAVRVEGRPTPPAIPGVIQEDAATGLLLCLDVKDSRPPLPAAARPARVRVTVPGAEGRLHTLGEVPLEADGSFLVRVPADQSLGFELLDADGRLLRSVPPFLWVRPGEIRSCMGCHPGHGMAPHNKRPQAVSHAPLTLQPPEGGDWTR